MASLCSHYTKFGYDFGVLIKFSLQFCPDVSFEFIGID